MNARVPNLTQALRHGTHRPGPAPDAPEVALTLDGQPVTARHGETILQLADRLGVAIPRLCAADGSAARWQLPQSCVVEIAGERTLAPSCCRSVAPGMNIQATSPRTRKAQNMVLELLLARPARARPQMGHRQPHPTPRRTQSMGVHSRGVERAPCLGRVAPRSSCVRSQPPRHGGEPGCLHQLQPLCACLP
jgi:hypothetical protein